MVLLRNSTTSGSFKILKGIKVLLHSFNTSDPSETPATPKNMYDKVNLHYLLPFHGK